MNYEERVNAQRKLNNSKMLNDYNESITVVTIAIEKNKEKYAVATTTKEKEKYHRKIDFYNQILKELKQTLKYLSNYYINTKENEVNNKKIIAVETTHKYNFKEIVNAYKDKRLDV